MSSESEIAVLLSNFSIPRSFPKISGIYSIICLANNYVYIGQSQDIRDRLREHYLSLLKNKHHNPFLQNAFNKYGSDCFSIAIIQEIPLDTEELNRAENYWMNFMQRYGIVLFNVCPIGGSRRGSTLSLEARVKMSAARKGKPKSEEHKQHMRESHPRLPMPSELKERLRSINTGKKLSPEQIEKRRLAHIGKPSGMLGKHHSEETKRKFSQQRKGRILSAEQREKMKGRKSIGSPKFYTFTNPDNEIVHIYNLVEFCRKQGLSVGSMRRVNSGTRMSHKGWTSYPSRGYSSNPDINKSVALTGKSHPHKGTPHKPESIEKMRIAQLGKKMSPEARQKMSAASKGKSKSEHMRKSLSDSLKQDFVFISPEGTITRVHGLQDFCKEHDLTLSTMSSLHSGKHGVKSHKGWRKYTSDNSNS